ncbi:MAG: PDZ domain-containing protein [Acidobacteriia bacterium]|nr:PDZ domain-containing protein [Terriglobia bacterium]
MRAVLLAIALAGCALAQGYIGVALVDSRSGTVVAQVAAGGPADRAGLKQGDLLLAINDRPVASAAGGSGAITSMAAGSTARLAIVRGGERRIVAITIGQKGGANQSLPSIPADAFSGPAVFDPKAPVPAGISFTKLTDPLEHAFTLDVPQGWKSEGALARLGALNINPYVRSLSPDKMTYILMGEPTMPTFAPPSAIGQKLGFREGSLYSPGFGQRVIVMHYLPGVEFARTFGLMAIGNLCSGAKLVSSKSRPEFAEKAQELDRPVIPTRYDAGEATFTCTHNKQEMQASVEAITWTTKDNVMWVAEQFVGFIAPKSQGAQAQAVAMHMLVSMTWDPAWVQKQNQLSKEAAEAIARRVQDFERQQASFTAKLNAVDQNFEEMDEIITGYSHYRDGRTGQSYNLSNTNPYKWIDDTGRIVSTPTNVKPPWGYSYRPLPRSPQ